MPNVYIETYGCSANQAESEIMAGLLKRSGFDIVKNIENSDLVIINTCLVKLPTEQKILDRIGKIDKKLIIAGCMPEVIYEKLIDIKPEASLFSTHHISKIPRAALATLNGKRVEYIGKREEIKLGFPRIKKNPIIDIIQISSGCNGECAYCCVRFAKGKLYSYPYDKIVKEINSKEVWLTSQDNASYDYEGMKLPGLLNKITSKRGNFFVRIGMMNPDNVKNILPELIESYKNKKIYKFLHLPIQSGDNEVLENMNRKYNVKDFLKITNEFEKNFNYQLWTDVIVGFPGETQEQFENTIKLIKEIKPDWVNISKYSPRPLIKKLKPLKSETIKKRSIELSKLVNEISLEKNKKWIDWSGYILVSEKGKRPNQCIGRNYAYKPVLIPGTNLLGKYLKVKVVDALSSVLIGKPLYGEI